MMATSFENIYDKFQSLITDTSHMIFTQAELEVIFQRYLMKSAHLDFFKCKKDLTDIDYVTKQFNEDLDDMEQWILAYGMTKSWIEPQIKYNRILRESYQGDSIKEHSHANLIDKLTSLLESTDLQLDKYKSDYAWREFEGFES